MNHTSDKAVPITVLTGFLGAGKTTLLNRILNGDHGLRVAVLVNDFGALNIDAQLVIGVEDGVISLANGCVCCTIRDDLRDAVLKTIDRPEAPEYIILEASGVADPSAIAMTFVDDGLRDCVRLDSVICVVDAEQALAHPERPAVAQLQLRQIAFSDIAILNKVDLVGAEKVKKIRQWIGDHFNRLRIVETNHCDAPLEILLSVGRFDAARLEFDARAAGHPDCHDLNCDHEDHRHGHAKTFSAWSYETERAISLEALRECVRKLPGDVYRAKGVIWSVEIPDQRAVLQVVGRRVDISVHGAWGQGTRRTQIVVIGAAGSIDAQLLEATFASCISPASGEPAPRIAELAV